MSSIGLSVVIVLLVLCYWYWTIDEIDAHPFKTLATTTQEFAPSSRRRILIHFGNNCCKKARKRNCDSGVARGFDECWSYRLSDIDTYFQQLHSDIFASSRGAGYWIWKPFVIYKTLLQLKDGDILMYSDVATEFIAPLAPLFELTETQDIVPFTTGIPEFLYTKRDSFVLMGLDDPKFSQSGQVLASFILFRRSIFSLNFVAEWLTYASDRRILTDDSNVMNISNYPDFKDHRHDQSVLSLLIKKWNIPTFPDPSQHGNGIPSRNHSQIIDHHRSKK